MCDANQMQSEVCGDYCQMFIRDIMDPIGTSCLQDDKSKMTGGGRQVVEDIKKEMPARRRA